MDCLYYFCLSLGQQDDKLAKVKLSEHADHTEKVIGVRAEDIHKWIDGFFDLEGFDSFLRYGKSDGFDPYGHRQYRHCMEALEDAFREFEDTYSHEQIRGVFETHLKDDYNGYLPVQKDFEDGYFKEKYHEEDDPQSGDRILNKAELNKYFSDKFYEAKQRRRKRNFNAGIWMRLLFPTIVAILLFISSLFALILPQFKDNLLDQKRLMIRELTASASSVIHHYTNEVRKGELDLKTAQQRAIREISDLRYGEENKDYFWITDMHPRMIMHPYREDLIGEDLSTYRDEENKSGKRLFVEFVKLVEKDNEGYLEYYWQWMDEPDRVAPKLSYVRGIPEWGWIIGTGIYINDVDQEISNLTRKILITFAFITLGLVALLAYILRQSLKIESSRQKAESGLIEAKNRYRTLVESSNEGYVLELEGEHVYSNLAFQRMLGYSEDECLVRDIWTSIIPDLDINRQARFNLQAVFERNTVRGEFEARARRKSGDIIDVVIRVSRIFFSEKNGHVISLRPISRKAANLAESLADIDDRTAPTESSDLLEEIRQSESEGHVIRILNQLPPLLGSLIRKGSDAGKIRDLIAAAFEATVIRYIELAIQDIGEPPCPFSFLSLGSAARHEMTLFSDQDNAFIFQDPEEGFLESHRKYFLMLTNRVCDKLNQAGFPFCQGGIMAANPKWCLSLSEWRENITSKFREATAESLLEVNIFLDFRHISGDPDLADHLQKYIFEASDNYPVFFKCYAQSYLGYRLPLSVFGKLKTTQREGMDLLNIKECLSPIVLFARIYALKHKISTPATVDRLDALFKLGILQESAYAEMTDFFRFFWKLRFNHQLREHRDLRKINEALNIDNLTEDEMQKCRRMLSSLTAYQSRVSFDFLGVDPSLVD